MGLQQEARCAIINILGAPFGTRVLSKDKITSISGGEHVNQDDVVIWLQRGTKDFLGSPIVPSREVTLIGPNGQEHRYQEVVAPEHKGERVIIHHR